ncbi:hypothetical protein [Paraburkholderia heleia]|uniref:hypothetical protein n=1 Tax=Paraburkholderia heleia TaxID=634127 RepID=UPI0031D61DC0
MSSTSDLPHESVGTPVTAVEIKRDAPPTLQVLEAIAQFFELETWQLLTPDLGRSLVATRTAARSGHLVRWPFARIKPANFNALPGEDRDEIEHQIAYKVKRLRGNSAHKKKT